MRRFHRGLISRGEVEIVGFWIFTVLEWFVFGFVFGFVVK